MKEYKRAKEKGGFKEVEIKELKEVLMRINNCMQRMKLGLQHQPL